VHRSTKTYCHEIGLSAAFRQWRATSHCRFIHGYALAVRLEFEADQLNDNGWVMDFGGLKPFKQWLEIMFDHKTLVAADDPQLYVFKGLETMGIIQLVVLEKGVGCERFAELIGEYAVGWLKDSGHSPRVRIALVEVKEHGANSAIWTPN
jgi:6-pyruvoyltetrahydropterin/6-carboxytetrahydropterin synthase